MGFAVCCSLKPGWCTTGASLQPKCVLDAVQRYQQHEATIGGYETVRRCALHAALLLAPFMQQLLNVPDDYVVLRYTMLATEPAPLLCWNVVDAAHAYM